MNFKEETLPDYRVAYMRRVGPYGPGNLEVMEKLKEWAQDKQLLESAVLLAVPQDNPETTPPGQCRFDACLVISPDDTVDDSVSEGVIPGGACLVYRIRHTAEAIQQAYSDIIQSLRGSEYRLDGRPWMERYTGDPGPNDYCEICVPVQV